MAKKTRVAGSAVPLKLRSKSVFLAGNFYHQVENLKNLIDLEGGNVVNELSDKTDIMVLGYSGIANPQKKALKLNAQGAAIQVLTGDQFEQLIKPTPDEAAQLLLSGPKGIERWNRHCGDATRYWGALPHSVQANRTPCLHGGDFSKADLSGANLNELVLQCDFSNANLTRSQLWSLSNCQLTGAKLDGVVELNLSGCTASNVDFSSIAAKAVHIESSDLSGSRFAKLADLDLDFKKCQLQGADFSGLRIREPQFHQCNLMNATFVGANIEEGNFAQSDLRGANFTNANLNLAKLNDTKVDGADFTGATMIGADVTGVDFSEAKGFDPSKVEAKGGPGVSVKEFIKVTAQAQRASTTLSVAQGTQSAVLSIHLGPQWAHCQDSAGNYYHTAHHSAQGYTQTTTADLWSKMAMKWHGATPDLASVTLRATKAPLANKELKQLAVRAWCELFGVEAPSEEDLKKAAVTTKASKKQKADEWLGILRTGKKGVEQWNDNVIALTRMLAKVPAVDLGKAELCGIKLRSVEWKNANFCGSDLAAAEIYGCRFPEANFSGASFKGAQVHSTFTDANLEKADFHSAKAAGSSFKRSNCKKARFRKANLQGADLCGADLTEADLMDAMLMQASYDENTRWPRGFTPTLEMIWKGPGTSPAAHKLVQSTKPKGKLNIDQFMKRLEELTDAAKLGKALSMLKADRFRLYAQVNNDHFVGVVKSQTDAELVYSCRLNADGTYACCTQNLNICGGLRGSLCKHLLVLIVGLTKNAELDPNVIDTWIRLSKTNKPALDKDAMSETFLRYKGAEAGEVDWRPTETIPEDYYAM
jgi:uncharacterized protein YjbI with pentapeptide repeats